MTSTRENERHDPEEREVGIELQELVLVHSRKTYDRYRVSCRAGRRRPEPRARYEGRLRVPRRGRALIKHSLHIAFVQLADAPFSRLVDDADEQPEADQPRWSIDPTSLRRDIARNSFQGAVASSFGGAEYRARRLSACVRADATMEAGPQAARRNSDLHQGESVASLR